MNEVKIEINKKLIGKTVKVLESEYEWLGEVVDVRDEDTFIISNGDTLVAVDIFNIRSVD
jgi:hypothetical protein